MSKIVTDFKVHSLELQLQAYPEITAALNAAKDARRSQLEAEIRALGFRPGEGKKTSAVAAKYLSKKNPALTWGGRGAMAPFLKAEMEETGLPLEAFKV